MSYIIIKDSFYVPHNVGATASITRLDSVILEKNLFGKYDAKVFSNGGAEPAEVYRDVRIGVESPALRKKLNLEGWLPCYPDMDDIVLACELAGNTVYWYRITYAYDNSTNK